MSSGGKSKLLRRSDRSKQRPSPVQVLITFASLAALLEIGSGCGLNNPNAPPTPPNPGGPVTVQEVLIKKGYVSGTVERIEGSDMTLEMPSGDSQAFRLTPKTLYYRAGTAISLAEIRVGEEVWIKTKENEKTGVLAAQKVLSGVRGELLVR
jgi:hypothetical protein